MVVQLVTAAGVLGVLTLVPGPDMAVVTKHAIAARRADGLWTVAGIVCGLLAWGLLTVAGLAALLAASAVAFTAVKVLGAAYLVYLGIRMLWRSRGAAPAPTAPPTSARGGAWRTGLVTNVLNPKIAVFYTGLLPTLAPAGLPPGVAMGVLVLLHAALTLAWLGGYVYLVARVRPVLERPRVRRALDRVTGVVLIGFGVRVATSTSH